MSQALATLVQGVLMSPECQEINFQMRGIMVSGAGYRVVHDLITHDRNAPRPRIWVTERSNLLNTHGMVGLYRPNYDRLDLVSLADASSPAGHGTVIHECTHAQLDMRRLQTPIRSEESVAYIAEAWYRLAAGHTNISNDLPNEIVTIATAIRARAVAAGPGGGVVDATQDEISGARAAIGALGYTNGHYISDGIAQCTYRRIQRDNAVRCH